MAVKYQVLCKQDSTLFFYTLNIEKFIKKETIGCGFNNAI